VAPKAVIIIILSPPHPDTNVVSVQRGLAEIEDQGKGYVYTRDWNSADKQKDVDYPPKKSGKQGKSSGLFEFFK
jgi:hypothetical protein